MYNLERFFLFSCFLICLKINAYANQDGHGHGHGVDSPSGTDTKQGAYATKNCTQTITPADRERIREFLSRSKELRQNLDSGNSLNTQLNDLVQEYSEKISPAGLSALSAVYTREQFLQFANGLQNDPSIRRAFGDFNEATDQRNYQRGQYKNAGYFERRSGRPDESLIYAGNKVNEKMNVLIKSINASPKIDSAYKKKVIKSLIKMQMSENDIDGNLASDVASKYEGYAAVAKTVRNGSIGAGLIVGGILTGGAVTAVGASAMASTVSTLGSSGAAAVGFLSTAAVGATAGAAGGAGFGLLRGEAAMIAKSTISDDSFMCSLVKEQAQHSQQIYKDALHFAAFGATIGGVGAGLSAAGGIYALIAEGGGAGLAAVGTVQSAVGAAEQASESKHLFAKAADARARGNEEEAKQLTEQAKGAAVEAGLSGIDGVLAGAATAQTARSFRTSLKEPAPLPAKIVEERQITNQKAAELKNTVPKENAAPETIEQVMARQRLEKELARNERRYQSGEIGEQEYNFIKQAKDLKDFQVREDKIIEGAIRKHDYNQSRSVAADLKSKGYNESAAPEYIKRLTGKHIQNESDVAKMASDVHEVWKKSNRETGHKYSYMFGEYDSLPANKKIEQLEVLESVFRARNNGKIPEAEQRLIDSYRSSLRESVAKESVRFEKELARNEQRYQNGEIDESVYKYLKESRDLGEIRYREDKALDSIVRHQELNQTKQNLNSPEVESRGLAQSHRDAETRLTEMSPEKRARLSENMSLSDADRSAKIAKDLGLPNEDPRVADLMKLHSDSRYSKTLKGSTTELQQKINEGMEIWYPGYKNMDGTARAALSSERVKMKKLVSEGVLGEASSNVSYDSLLKPQEKTVIEVMSEKMSKTTDPSYKLGIAKSEIERALKAGGLQPEEVAQKALSNLKENSGISNIMSRPGDNRVKELREIASFAGDRRLVNETTRAYVQEFLAKNKHLKMNEAEAASYIYRFEDIEASGFSMAKMTGKKLEAAELRKKALIEEYPSIADYVKKYEAKVAENSSIKPTAQEPVVRAVTSMPAPVSNPAPAVSAPTPKATVVTQTQSTAPSVTAPSKTPEVSVPQTALTPPKPKPPANASSETLGHLQKMDTQKGLNEKLSFARLASDTSRNNGGGASVDVAQHALGKLKEVDPEFIKNPLIKDNLGNVNSVVEIAAQAKDDELLKEAMRLKMVAEAKKRSNRIPAEGEIQGWGGEYLLSLEKQARDPIVFKDPAKLERVRRQQRVLYELCEDNMVIRDRNGSLKRDIEDYFKTQR